MNPFASSSGPAQPPSLSGAEYLQKLHRYIQSNLPRLAPTPRIPSSSFLQQSYTLLTLGLDPSSAPLSRNVKIPLTLGFGQPSTPPKQPVKPLLLRLPPDRLLYLLLRWQALPQGLPHVGRTDVPVDPSLGLAARGARLDVPRQEGDVRSVRSWVGSMRSVSLGSMSGAVGGMQGWFGNKQLVDEDHILLDLYSAFTVLPALLIHPPFLSDPPIAELIEAGGYTQLGGIDVRIPLDVLRNVQILELEGYDPRGLLIPPNPGLRSLTVRDVQDADEWIEELLVVPTDPIEDPTPADSSSETPPQATAALARFPNLRHLSLPSCTLLSLPTLPLSRLTHLDLSHNLLNSIPSSLSALSSLVSLNLSTNLITSVRNAPSSLGNVTSLNLSKNRIDCLVGLERVLGLERVDLRGNELVDVGEVGRLAVLPMLKEVWTGSNPFAVGEGATASPVLGTEDWRVELGVAFAREGRTSVVFDDRPFSWAEQRRIDASLAARGHRKAATAPQLHHHHPHVHSSVPSPQTRPTSTVASPVQRPMSPSSPAGPSYSPAAITSSSSRLREMSGDSSSSPRTTTSAVRKKKPARRVINLDDAPADTSAGLPEEARVIGGSMRLPAKSMTIAEDEIPTNGSNGSNGSHGTEVKLVQKKGRRARVSASMYEPPPASAD